MAFGKIVGLHKGQVCGLLVVAKHAQAEMNAAWPSLVTTLRDDYISGFGKVVIFISVFNKSAQ